MHVAEKVLRYIEDSTGAAFTVEERLAARCYALVHDITHIPFGHTIEDELGFYVRHERNAERISRLISAERSSVGALLRSTDYGRAVLRELEQKDPKGRNVYIKGLVEGLAGADVLDYIDRDSYFCGLEHRVDSAIFRRFRVVPLPGVGAGRLVSQIYGKHGLRLDAEFALESVLLERFALFMKVYTHPAKIAAGAMLGKALSHLVGGKRSSVDERTLESLGDLEVLHLLRTSTNRSARTLGEMLWRRELYRPVFRARPVPGTERALDRYATKLTQFREKKLVEPLDRRRHEGRIADRAGTGITPLDVIIYIGGGAPGLQKVQQYVQRDPTSTEVRDEAHVPHLGIMQRHLALWSVYVFASPSVDDASAAKIGEAAEDLLGLTNEIAYERRQKLLFE
jgi:HD superfamily phosphohydrolase